MSSENRRAKRRQVSQTVEVVDMMAEATVARIANLSPGGMLVIASVPMIDDALYQFRFNLSGPDGRERAIDVGAHQLWSDAGSATGQSWAGFRFIDISARDAEFLQGWVEAPGSRYA